MKFLNVVLLFISVNTFAQAPQDLYRIFPVLECPAVGEEFEKMISKLEGIKSSIRKDANCSNVQLQVENLEQLVVSDRETVMNIVSQSQNAPLTEDQARQVRNYAENVTKKVAALNDLFMRTNQCFEKDQADKQLSTLAGFVSEASGLVASLTGPWGAPIALAGNVVAGFLTGMDQVLKTRAGYDFSKREQWMSYVENLCTYHSYRDQIEHLLDPEARLAQLRKLKVRLDVQIETMTRTCSECQSIANIFNSQNDKSPETLRNLANNEISAADQRFNRPVGSYTLQSLGLRSWVTREIARIEKESKTFWSDVSGRNLLYRAKNDIEKFLLEREAPRFLSYQVAQAGNDYSEFLYYSGSEGKRLYSQIESEDPQIISRKLKYVGWSDPLEVFRSLVVSLLNFDSVSNRDSAEDLKFAWAHFRDKSMEQFKSAQTSTQVSQTFCSFFKHSGNYSPAIRGACNSPQLKQLISVQNQVETEMHSKPNLINLNVDDDKSYSLNRVDALTRAIELRTEP